MWGALLAGAFFSAINPVRLAIVALLISRPRPTHNLLAYWIGAMVAGLPTVLIPLMVLNATTAISSVGSDVSASATYRQIQFGAGVLALSIAALMIMRSLAPQRARAASPSGKTRTPPAESNEPFVISRLLGHTEDGPTEGASAVRRVLSHANDAWQDGALWVAAVLGMVTGGPSLDGIFFGLAIIMTSGAAINTQVAAAVVWVFAILAVVEIILASLLISPVKAQAVLQIVHDWLQVHRRKILIAILAVVGLALTAQNAQAIWG
jgi:hypothetical protein